MKINILIKKKKLEFVWIIITIIIITIIKGFGVIIMLKKFLYMRYFNMNKSIMSIYVC